MGQYIIKIMSLQFSASENIARKKVRAKYIPMADGSYRLSQIQAFSHPTFLQAGYESGKKWNPDIDLLFEKHPLTEEEIKANIMRASRRAKTNAFDYIVSNPCLDTFATFTFRPEESIDKSSYDDCYGVLKVFLSNRVQRNNLKYVIVPEHHKSGDIHFHGIMNSEALKLTPAINPYNGEAIIENGKAVFNIKDWKAGFSTAQIIGGTDEDRVKVAKYIFKYMGKQSGQKIGGRYCLIGGNNLNKPVYVYADSIDEIAFEDPPKYEREVEISSSYRYKELCFM